MNPNIHEGQVNFHSKCKMLGGVAEFVSEAFLCRFPPEDLPRPVVYPVHSLRECKESFALLKKANGSPIG